MDATGASQEYGLSRGEVYDLIEKLGRAEEEKDTLRRERNDAEAQADTLQHEIAGLRQIPRKFRT